jgi:2-isopropylmalate synthase
VIFDAEHYFDGYRNIKNKKYTLETVQTAIGLEADIICLCETNGGMLSFGTQNIVRKTTNLFSKVKFGIHAHNVIPDTPLKKAALYMVQGTVN